VLPEVPDRWVPLLLSLTLVAAGIFIRLRLLGYRRRVFFL
jgi:hypothetical protein